MFSSIILMLSQYDRNREMSNLFKIIWVLYAIMGSLYNPNLVFFVTNISTFMLVTGFIWLIKKIFPNSNTVFSVASVLIYSLIVDISCYYLIPSCLANPSLLSYILNGFIFNFKYLVLNVLVFCMVVLLTEIYKKCKTKRVLLTNLALLNKDI